MEILIIFLLILLNGLFSMSEIALVSSRKIRLESAAKAGKKGAATAYKLAMSPNIFLSTVQIGITLVGLLTGIYSGENLTNDLEEYLARFDAVSSIADGLAVSIVLVAITFVTLVLGELVPKRLGLSNPEGISRMIAPLMELLSKVAYPFVWILTHVSDVILKVFGISASTRVNITEEEIKAIIRQGTEDGEIQKVEQAIVERVFQMGDRKVKSFMRPRTEIVYISMTDDRSAMTATIGRHLHRVYPVYEDSEDNIVGVIYLKDILTAIHAPTFYMRNYIKSAHYLPENTSAYKALEKFKVSGVQYALIIDEYGAFLGLVTMEDILRRLVGDQSEFYGGHYEMSQLADGSWLVDGQYPLTEFLMQFDISNREDQNQIITIAGLILEELKDIPTVGQKIGWKDFIFEVAQMEHARIDKVIVRRQSD